MSFGGTLGSPGSTGGVGACVLVADDSISDAEARSDDEANDGAGSGAGADADDDDNDNDNDDDSKAGDSARVALLVGSEVMRPVFIDISTSPSTALSSSCRRVASGSGDFADDPAWDPKTRALMMPSLSISCCGLRVISFRRCEWDTI